MKIVDIREIAVPIKSDIRNAYIDFSQMTVSALAVITDVGDEKDIHPRQKEPVGARLALAARALASGSRQLSE